MQRLVGIVTGGAKGIGRGICEHLLKSGKYAIVAADIDVSSGLSFWQEMISKNEEFKGCFDFIETDVSSEESVKQLVHKVLQKYNKIDLLINNAAIANPYHSKLEELELETWQKYLSVNLTSVFLCSKHVLKSLKQSKGSIINIASTRASMSEPMNGEAYCATKGGIVSFTHSLAQSYGKEGIRVNCISPGWIQTFDYDKLSKSDHEQHPVGRVGKVEDIAHMAEFLADSNKSGFMTGQNIVVDGGMTTKMIYSE